MTTTPSRTRLIAALLATAALVLSSCGGDDGGSAQTETDGGTEAGATAPGTEDTTEEAGADDDVADGLPVADTDDTVTVVMSDYAFEGIPDEVPAGTRFAVENVSSIEMHEVVAVRLPDDEERTIDELGALSLAELGPLMAAGPPAVVLIALPESDEMIAPYGDTLDEPGRYLIGCFIPIGADMDHEGPPTPDMEPFHYESGMITELVVT